MEQNELLRSIPQANTVLEHPDILAFGRDLSHDILLRDVRAALDDIRKSILSGQRTTEATVAEVASVASGRLSARLRPFHYRVINATGIILNTSLGRAPLPSSVAKHISDGIAGYMRLAAHPKTGRRYDRDILVGQLFAEITGGEAATFCNNNAAATYLVLSALAAGKEVIVSRGQLVEIGGQFRIPDVLAASGAKLVEVGTTNRTHLKDYRKAITERTGVILRVHTSNYRITGFASTPSIGELSQLAHENNLLCIDDIGSGQLVDFGQLGIPNDYPLSESIGAGADIVCFSGDKLMGGVQAGIIIGKAALIEKIRSHPLARAFRCGKMTVLGLEGMARLYMNPQRARKEIPALAMLATPLAELKKTAGRIAKHLRASYEVKESEDETYVGGGSLPDVNLRTYTLQIARKGMSAEELAEALRAADPPVFARVAEDHVILDLRTLLAGEEKLLIKALLAIPKKENG
ncbi:MAG: L-seryl-tRNA(Sec) selenium transferase [Candidatus Brocadiia bacterium]